MSLTADHVRVPLSVAALSSGRRLRIGLDLDGVVYNFVAALRDYIVLTTGRAAASMPDALTWNFYCDQWGLTLKEFLTFMEEAVNAGYLFRTGVPMEGVIEGTAALIDAGHEIHIVTDRSVGLPGLAAELTRAYLAEHAIAHTTLTIAADKTSVPTDVFIEDRPENYLSLRAAGVDAFLRSHPYNLHVATPAGRRVANFSEFVERIMVPQN